MGRGVTGRDQSWDDATTRAAQLGLSSRERESGASDSCARAFSAPRRGPHLCHVDELLQYLSSLRRPGAAQHHDLHPARHAVAETYGALQGRAAPHGALQNVAPQVLGLGVRWASGGAGASRPRCSHAHSPLQ